MGRPRRILASEAIVKGWAFKAYLWEDSETGALVGYNFQYQRSAASGFVEFIRFDLHKRGDPSEDSPHLHIRLESRALSRADESTNLFSRILPMLPSLERVSR